MSRIRSCCHWVGRGLLILAAVLLAVWIGWILVLGLVDPRQLLGTAPDNWIRCGFGAISSAVIGFALVAIGGDQS